MVECMAVGTLVLGIAIGYFLTDPIRDWVQTHGRCKILDLNAIDFTNPYLKMEQIKSCNTIKVVIIEYTAQHSVLCKIPNVNTVQYVNVFLPIKDLIQVSIGDHVLVRGKFDADDYGGKTISITVKHGRLIRNFGKDDKTC